MHALGGIMIGIAVSFGRRDTADRIISLVIAIAGIVVLELAK